ncbi:hypothetical protein CTT30_12575 [Vibrio coralliilyticus]|nr:hypothetical protein CTT30_12575 [Vibrio coralliilyticus]
MKSKNIALRLDEDNTRLIRCLQNGLYTKFINEVLRVYGPDHLSVFSQNVIIKDIDEIFSDGRFMEDLKTKVGSS